ncbi:hypothetical protein LTR70_003018 [Exophiala xenobiotica]|uniref:Uncharacterized protein n=1 Tax=Lithohypha guttulata TaxID=1690604 RepID=A0ABR0K863_9EURO|nr:hypothetical protein LTR24_005698 [Lithohypha guttulata]KAK5324388.1 hypothetical protein LTR70_003018 [Exophiala xenobiotica]
MRCSAAPYGNRHGRTSTLSDDAWIGLLFGEDDNQPVNALNRLDLGAAGPEDESPQLSGNGSDEQREFEKRDLATEGTTEEHPSASAREQSSVDQSAGAAHTNGKETKVLSMKASDG